MSGDLFVAAELRDPRSAGLGQTPFPTAATARLDASQKIKVKRHHPRNNIQAKVLTTPTIKIVNGPILILSRHEPTIGSLFAGVSAVCIELDRVKSVMMAFVLA
jgi:hypothetical protein